MPTFLSLLLFSVFSQNVQLHMHFQDLIFRGSGLYWSSRRRFRSPSFSGCVVFCLCRRHILTLKCLSNPFDTSYFLRPENAYSSICHWSRIYYPNSCRYFAPLCAALLVHTALPLGCYFFLLTLRPISPSPSAFARALVPPTVMAAFGFFCDGRARIGWRFFCAFLPAWHSVCVALTANKHTKLFRA